MAEIPASMVMKLRKLSSQGLMDCKKALQEANGDVGAAMEILRKKGLATLSKRAERETSDCGGGGNAGGLRAGVRGG
ncbi:MAG: hypothetical protein ACYS21_20710 [Planctomycetota bacterium]|jgi:elongation factor Ts